MNFLRRVAFALGIAAAQAKIMRFRNRSTVTLRRGGWRPLRPPQFR
jgi:hypothetical protein